MRRIHKLLLGAILPPFLVSLTVLTFIVFIRELGRLAELLVTHNAPLAVIGFVAATILPPILIFSLPMSYLVGILIGLSGLSSENQIVALRACGIPTHRLLGPTLSLGGAVLLATLVLSIIVLPSTNDRLHSLKDRINLRQATSQVQARVFSEELGNIVFYVDDLALDRQRWERVFVADNSNPRAPRLVLAREGSWVSDPGAFRLQLHLRHGTIYEVDPSDPAKDNTSVFESTDIPVDLTQGMSHRPLGYRAGRKEPLERSTSDLWRGAGGDANDRRAELLELHKRIALPFSVIGFALVGLALGITTRKGGRASGFILSFVLVLLFYNLFMNGQRLASVGKIAPWLGAWGANLVLTALGLLLLAMAERAGMIVARVSSLRLVRQSKSEPGIGTGPTGAAVETAAADDARGGRLRFPKMLDRYVSRGFFLYFVWSAAVCTTLFIVLTLFDLLDDIIKNRIPLGQVVDYFVFLTPQILLLVVPMAILLATLINFGILEKSSEVTALKAGGWSLYRISMPVFLIAATLCIGVYLLQDYVLPYANIRQDSLRHVIKGRPAQTSMRPQRKWIFGEANRVFNYDYFDSGKRLLVGFNLFEIDLDDQKIERRIHAERAWIGDDGGWTLEDGWVRDFRPASAGFQRIERARFPFRETAAYFEKEIFEPRESSKLTYLELRGYIEDLKRSGYNATQLQIELYKKISFPLSCVVMALVGVPFSFQMGRRGAFFGITLSIGVAMAYWGVFSLFEVMGAYGLLVPLLAAWAPNLLFGATGLLLLLHLRT